MVVTMRAKDTKIKREAGYRETSKPGNRIKRGNSGGQVLISGTGAVCSGWFGCQGELPSFLFSAAFVASCNALSLVAAARAGAFSGDCIHELG